MKIPLIPLSGDIADIAEVIHYCYTEENLNQKEAFQYLVKRGYYHSDLKRKIRKWYKNFNKGLSVPIASNLFENPIEFIDELIATLRFNHQITLEELAPYAGLKEKTLERIIKAIGFENHSDFWLELRPQKIKDPIEEIYFEIFEQLNSESEQYPFEILKSDETNATSDSDETDESSDSDETHDYSVDNRLNWLFEKNDDGDGSSATQVSETE